jgi:hypothetical protein
LLTSKIFTEKYGKIINNQHNCKLNDTYATIYNFFLTHQKKNNKHIQVSETNINMENNEESLYEKIFVI